MTLPLRRKHQTTARGRITPARTGASVLAVLFLAAGTAIGQQAPPPLPSTFPSQPLAPVAPAPVPSQAVAIPGQVQQAAIQQVPGEAMPRYGRSAKEDDTDFDFQVYTELPSPNTQMRRDSEADFFERLRQTARRRLGSERVPFPEETPLTKESYTPRRHPPVMKLVEPSYVAYGRLIFEQPNWERAAWSLGPFQPLVCMGGFMWDTITYPYQFCKRPFQQVDTSAGKTLPGDPDPLVLYPPEISVTGLLGQAATMVPGFLVFPSWLNPK